MSTTLELPDDVMREVERQALRAGSDPSTFLTSFLRHRLPIPTPEANTSVPKDFPVIKGRLATPDKQFASPQEFCDWLKEQEMSLEVENHEKAFGYQFVDRVHG